MILCLDPDQLEDARGLLDIGPRQVVSLLSPHQLLKARRMRKDPSPHPKVIRSTSTVKKRPNVHRGERLPRHRRLLQLVADPSQHQREVRRMEGRDKLAPPGKTDPKPVNVGGADAMTKAVDVPAVPSCANSSASTGVNPAAADHPAADGAMADPAAANGATADPAAANGTMACPGEKPPVR
jgi:hypothetical protein